MQRLLAITALTWKAAFRFRLFWVLAGLLIGSVIVLPLMLKDDGTARGFTQILLTYTLSVMTTLLGFATLWLSCGTLARPERAGSETGAPPASPAPAGPVAKPVDLAKANEKLSSLLNKPK